MLRWTGINQMNMNTNIKSKINMKSKITIANLAAISTVTILGLAGNLQAATVIVDATTKNGSFETPVVTANGGSWDNGVPSPWSVWNTTAFTQRTGGVTPQDGAQYVGIDWYAGISSIFMSYPNVGVTIEANTTYTMTAWVRTESDTNDIVGNISIYGWTSGGYVEQATTSLMGIDSTWKKYTATFTTGLATSAVGSALQFELVKESGSSKLLFDNVVVTSIPEPSAAALGCWQRVGCLLRRRR